MDTTVSLGQLITAIVAIIGAMLMFWNNTNVRIKVLEMKVQLHDELVKKMDDIREAIHNIDIKLTNKADK